MSVFQLNSWSIGGLLADCHDGALWTAGQRFDPVNDHSPFVWKARYIDPGRYTSYEMNYVNHGLLRSLTTGAAVKVACISALPTSTSGTMCHVATNTASYARCNAQSTSVCLWHQLLYMINIRCTLFVLVLLCFFDFVCLFIPIQFNPIYLWHKENNKYTNRYINIKCQQGTTMRTVKTSNAVKVPTGNQGRDNPAKAGTTLL